VGGLPSESILIITIEQDIAGVKGGSHIIRKDLEPFLLRDQFEVMKKKRKKRYEIKKKNDCIIRNKCLTSGSRHNLRSHKVAYEFKLHT
jgi:hypothetical protein